MYIYIAAAIGAALRIIEDDGYIAIPKFENGRLDLGIIGKLGFGIVGVSLAIQTGYPGFETPLMAFAIGFIVPFSVERFVTKIPYGNPTVVETNTTSNTSTMTTNSNGILENDDDEGA